MIKYATRLSPPTCLAPSLLRSFDENALLLLLLGSDGVQLLALSLQHGKINLHLRYGQQESMDGSEWRAGGRRIKERAVQLDYDFKSFFYFEGELAN